MIELNPGQAISYRIGFNTYTDMFAERDQWLYSDQLTAELPIQKSLTGKYSYPLQLNAVELSEIGRDKDFELSGSHQVILFGPTKQLLEFSFTLKSSEFLGNALYQIFLQLEQGEDSYESYIFTGAGSAMPVV